MALEKAEYRDNLQRLSDRWPDRDMIPLAEVAAYLCVDYRTLLRADKFPVKQIAGTKRHRTLVVPIVGLARWLSCN